MTGTAYAMASTASGTAWRSVEEPPAASGAMEEGQDVASEAVDEAQDVASEAADQAQEVASTAAEEGRRVARAAGRDAREVTDTAREQVGEVTSEAMEQGRGLLEEARDQLQEQADTQVERLAETLRRLGGEAAALADGSPGRAGAMPAYVRDVANRLEGLADEIDSRGVQGVLEELQRFARRRPGAFLVGAAIAGFGVGRLVRAGSGDSEESPAAMGAAAGGRGR